MTTQTIERSTQVNCAKCPYFQDFDEPNGRGLCQMFDKVARRQHFRTGDCDQEIKAVEVAQPPAPPPTPQQMQPAGFSGDSTGCQLRPTFEAPQELEPEAPTTPKLDPEFVLGSIHGRNNALAGWHPIYKKPVTEYARGYLSGYNAGLNPTAIQPDVTQAAEWSVSLDPRWGLYQAWVGSSCLGLAATHEEAERMAQAYVANGETIKQQNAMVMAAYALTKEHQQN